MRLETRPNEEIHPEKAAGILVSKPYFKGTQREHFSKVLEISYSAFLECFRTF